MSTVDSKAAVHGQKMIEVKVRFWTNDLADGAGRIRPKHCRTSGVVRLKRNETHGIKDVKPIPFHSLLDILAAIEKLLIREEIKLHPSRKMRKLLQANEDRV
jgi:hypothetical protein